MKILIARQFSNLHDFFYQKIHIFQQASHLTLAQGPDNMELSRHYISTAKRITDKLVLKIDPQMKRTICKCCHSLLIPGISARHRIRGKREKHLVVACMTCGTIKRWRTFKDSKQSSTTAVDEDTHLEKEDDGVNPSL